MSQHVTCHDYHDILILKHVIMYYNYYDITDHCYNARILFAVVQCENNAV